jgi:BarA-like signal transduction histidine kinase
MKYVTDQPIDKMSKRFFAAEGALRAILSNKDFVQLGISISKKTNLTNSQTLVRMAYEFADELIKQEHEQKG